MLNIERLQCCCIISNSNRCHFLLLTFVMLWHHCRLWIVCYTLFYLYFSLLEFLTRHEIYIIYTKNIIFLAYYECFKLSGTICGVKICVARVGRRSRAMWEVHWTWPKPCEIQSLLTPVSSDTRDTDITPTAASLLCLNQSIYNFPLFNIMSTGHPLNDNNYIAFYETWDLKTVSYIQTNKFFLKINH